MRKTPLGGGVLNRLDKNYPLFIHKLGYKFFACLATLVFILSTALLLILPNTSNDDDTGAVAPSFEPATLAAATTLADTITDNQDDPNIYKVETSTGIDFHIKTAEGFLKLSEATAAGSAFDPSWTFYLDNNITLNVDENYCPIGGTNNPFLGTFDGQNNQISFTAHVVDPIYECLSLFGYLGTCTIQNLSLYIDISYDYLNVCGLFYESEPTNDQCVINLTRVNINGVIGRDSEDYAGMGYGICEDCRAKLSMYDCKLNLKGYFIIVISAYMREGGELSMDSCDVKFEDLDDSAPAIFDSYLFENDTFDIRNSKFEIFSDATNIWIFSGNGSSNITCSECQFDVISSMNVKVVFCSELRVKSINLYDVVINSIFTGSDYNNWYNEKGFLDDGHDYLTNGNCLYSGILLTFQHLKGNEVVVLNSDFTSYKWRIDTSDENALPVLAAFQPAGKDRNPNMESLNMVEWAKQKMAK